MDIDDEVTLVSLAVDGDERAWDVIVRRYTRSLEAVARAFRLTPEEMADASQLTWLRAVEHLGELRERARLRPWLISIMRHECLRVRNTGHRDELTTDWQTIELRAGSADVEREVVIRHEAGELRRAMATLEGRERALLHALAEDLSYREISRRLGMPVGSIGPTRQRAFLRLRTALASERADFGEAA